MLNNNYNAVHKIKRTTKRESGLFRFLSQTKYNTLQDYILINLTCANTLYDIVNMHGYVMLNRHIRIDRFFVKANTVLATQKLLSHWHYTEEYRHINKPPLKLHVYFNQAIFLLACIHQKDDFFSEIIDKAVLTKVRMNTYEAEQIVNGFLRELTSYRIHLEAEFNTLLEKFELEDINDLTEKEFAAYIEICKQRSAELTSYMEDRIDKRADLLEANLKKLRTDYKNFMPATKNKTQPNVDLSINQKNDTTLKLGQLTAPLTKQKAITQTLQDAKLFIEKYKSKQNAKQLLELMTEKNLILGELLQNWQENKSRHDAATRLCIEQIHNLPDISSKILDLAFEGQMQDIRFLYNHESTYPYMQSAFFFQFFTISHMFKNPESMLDLCIFFYEHAPGYREILSILPYLSTRRKSEFDNISFLVEIAQENNFALFKLLLEQINSPIIVGACFDNKSIPLIHYVLANDYEQKYIQALLDINILTEYSGVVFILEKYNLGKNENDDTRTKTPSMEVRELLYYNSAFVIGCHRLIKDQDILPLLLHMAQQTSVISWLLGVSSFIKSTSYRIDFIQTKGILKVVNTQEFNTQEQIPTRTDEDFALYMQITLVDDFLQQSNFLGKILEMVNDKALANNATNDELYEKCVRHLLTFALEQEKVKYINNAIAAYYAQLILLCSTTPNIKHHSNILSLLIRIIQLDSLPQESKERFKHTKICQKALSTLIQYSPFKTMLTADPRVKIRIETALKTPPQTVVENAQSVSLRFTLS